MAVFSLSDFADHEQVVFVSDDKSGLKAIIAIHNSNLGPALGGCRMWPYASEDEAIRDVLRLSRGMTYKSAMARLKLGGGKSVIIGNPRTHKTPELLAALARALEQLNGRYIAAEDSGTSVADMKIMAQLTSHVAGIVDKPSDQGTRSGDPSPATAYGVFVGIKAAVQEKLGRDSLAGLRIAERVARFHAHIAQLRALRQLRHQRIAQFAQGFGRIAHQGHGVALRQRLGEGRDHRIDSTACVGLGQLGTVGNGFDEFGFVHFLGDSLYGCGANIR